MVKTGRSWMTAVAVGIGCLMTPPAAAANPAESLTIGLLVMNQADVDSQILARAQDEAVRIYKGLGINLVWSDVDTVEVDYRLTVKIIAKAIAGKGVDGRAMGVAPGTKETRGTLAYAFYGRIQDVTRTIGADVGLILGHVIVHEIGHLLLPYDSHAKNGLMRGGWDTQQAMHASRGSLTFTPQETALIRARLQNVSATTARR